MSNWGSKFNMSHPLTANFGASYFNSAPLANNSFEAYALIFTAVALPIPSWSKDLLIKETIFFRL